MNISNLICYNDDIIKKFLNCLQKENRNIKKKTYFKRILLFFTISYYSKICISKLIYKILIIQNIQTSFLENYAFWIVLLL